MYMEYISYLKMNKLLRIKLDAFKSSNVEYSLDATCRDGKTD